MGVYGENIFYHIAAFFISFDLICNMTCSEKLEFGPHTQGWEGGGRAGKMLLPCCGIRDPL